MEEFELWMKYCKGTGNRERGYRLDVYIYIDAITDQGKEQFELKLRYSIFILLFECNFGSFYKSFQKKDNSILFLAKMRLRKNDRREERKSNNARLEK